jgi:hypothetical protein
MRAISGAILALVLTVAGVSQTNSVGKRGLSGSDRERLIGAWRLRSMSGPDGKPMATGVPTGMLIYTRDGHVSVQLMYPRSAATLSNEYVQNGYEASFGSYDIKRSNSYGDPSCAGGEYGRPSCRQGPAAPLSIQLGRAPDHQVGTAGRTLVRHLATLLTR